MLKNKILSKESGIILYGLTPPKINNDEEKIQSIADKQIERIEDIGIDGLVLYDIQDESSRNNTPRPFPYMQTLAPDEYSNRYLTKLNVPKIIYKSVGKHSSSEFKTWLNQNSRTIDCSVFVGSPSKNQIPALSLADAYSVYQESKSDIILGGVTIPERHYKKEDEHTRLFNKIDKGCNFFISQCVYNINHTKDFLSDYYYGSLNRNREMKPVIFTLTPCGSVKTMQFMEWLGIDIPKWLKNDLKHSHDILTKSIDICTLIATEIVDYCKEKNIPYGFNIESVAIRKEEIKASIELVTTVKTIMQ